MKTYNHNNIELLAPAGNRETLESVIKAGANAVYLGAQRYSMRQHGNWVNFKDEELADSIEYAHSKNVKIYVTLNALLSSLEIIAMKDFLFKLESMRPDGVIAQDLGLLAIMNELKISIPRHASTMMNVHHAVTARFLKEAGVSRIVTSRDITIQQAGEIGRLSGVEIEYFVHGDMCVAQSSQCLHSGLATEMSANRGKCLKSCRWQWSLIDRGRYDVLANVEEKYVLARKDICLLHQLPDLFSHGITSLKIEGRARPAEYLEPIVRIYRTAIDRYLNSPISYQTDFKDIQFLKKHNQRELHSNHAFLRPGPTSVDLTGQREPRFFSIAVEERPYSLPAVKELIERAASCQSEEFLSAKIPELSVRCADLKSAGDMADADCDWIYAGGEMFAGRANSSPEDWLELIDRCHKQGKKVGIQTPRITTDRELGEIEKLVRRLSDNPPDEYLVHNLGALAKMRGLTDVPIHADFSFNIWNAEAAGFLKKSGASFLTPGLELDIEQLLALAGASELPMECMIHGSLTGMLLEYCVIGAHMGGTSKSDSCPGPCSFRQYALESKIKDQYPLEADQYCRNHLFMSKDLCTLGFVKALRGPRIKRLRIEGQLYEPSHLRFLIALYRNEIHQVGNEPGRTMIEEGYRSLLAQAPRPLSPGAYANHLPGISEPLAELPTNILITYGGVTP